MRFEVYSAICGFRTPCEHLDHFQASESGVEFFTMVIIVFKGGDLFSSSEKLLSSFSYHWLLHTHDVYTIHA